MFLTPDQYGSTSVKSLLAEIASGRAPLDHAMLRALLDRPDETAEAIVTIGNGPQTNWRFDLSEDLLLLARHLNDPRTLPFLVDLLNSDDPPELVFDVFALLDRAALDPLLAAYADEDDAEVRSHLAFALAALGIEDERIETIAKDGDPDGVSLELYHSRGEKALPAFDLFEEYPETSVPLVEVLSIEERFELLESTLEDHRILAAASLYREELPERQLKKIFDTAMTEPAPFVRSHLWQALEAGLDRPEFLDEMMRRVADSSVPEVERCGLIVGLAALADRPIVNKAIFEFYADPKTRLKAVEAMWRSQDPDFARYFPTHLDDPNIDIRRIALRGIGVHGLTSELGRIRKLLADEDVREEALFAYAMTAPSKDSPAYLRTLYKKIEKEVDGFTEGDEEVVRVALDMRLRAAGKQPVFLAEAHNISG